MANLNIGNSTANVKVTLNQNGDVHFRNGSLDFDSSSLPQFSGTPQYLVGIESFANGGTLKWAEKASVSVGSADKFTSAKSITLTGDVTGTTSSQAGWSIVTTANKLTSAGHLDTVEKLDAFIESNKLKFATVASIGGVASDGMIISVPWSTSGWGHQIFLDDSAMVMQHRHRYTKTNSDGSTAQAWSGWATLLDSNNYNNYAPSKTGTGASGTWGISVSGNAATATKLATARTISLTGSVTGSGTFDGSGNLSIATTTNHTHAAATTSANGFMSSSDKSKLDGIATGANKYSHPTYTSRASGLYKITVDGTGHVSAATAVAKSDITALGIPSTNTTYSVATTSSNGLMSSSDKTKLNKANINVYKMSNINTVATGSSEYVDIGFCSGYNTSFGGTYICISISWQGYAIQFRMGQGASTVKTRCTNTSKQWTSWH